MSTAAHKIRMVMELRRSGISDTGVLSAIERIPREIFVPDLFRDQAYENRALPIGQGQTLSQPQVVAQMTQALAFQGRLKVLEIGTGSGYQTAVLARLARWVTSLERIPELARRAIDRMRRSSSPSASSWVSVTMAPCRARKAASAPDSTASVIRPATVS